MVVVDDEEEGVPAKTRPEGVREGAPEAPGEVVAVAVAVAVVTAPVAEEEEEEEEEEEVGCSVEVRRGLTMDRVERFSANWRHGGR